MNACPPGVLLPIRVIHNTYTTYPGDRDMPVVEGI